MESLCGIGFEHKRYSRICGVDMSANPVNSNRWFTRERWVGMFYLANSKRDPVVAAAFLFFTSRMFRGDEGQCKARRSWSRVSLSALALFAIVRPGKKEKAPE